MTHLTSIEMDALVENQPLPPAAREHFTTCELCHARVMRAQRLERALGHIARVEPETDLSARIVAALPRQAQQPNANPWLGVATLLAALIGFALAYQTAFSLNANGTFELVSYYTAQPEIVTTYPNEAWSALAGSIPWMTATLSLAVLVVALVLTYRWTSRTVRVTG